MGNKNSQDGAVSIGSGHQLRIISLAQGSPLFGQVALYVDSIRAVNGIRNCDLDSRPVADSLQFSSGKAQILVHNLITDSERLVVVYIKSFDIEKAVSLQLGVGFFVEPISEADKKILRVTQVVSNSPADDACLKAGSDFVVFSLSFKYQDLKTFCDQVKETCKQWSITKPESQSTRRIKLVVYSLAHDELRVVSIIPYERWSPINGWLGAQFGDGTVDNFRVIQSHALYKPIEQSNTGQPDSGKKLPLGVASAQQTSVKEPNQLLYLSVDRVPYIPAVTFLPLGRKIETRSVNLFSDTGIIFHDSDSQELYRITKNDLILLDKDFPDCRFEGIPKLNIIGGPPSHQFDGLDQLRRENSQKSGSIALVRGTDTQFSCKHPTIHLT